jgi:phosphate transport system permease protein
MGFWSFFFIIISLGFATQWYGTNKALKLNSKIKEGPKLPSLPSYYGMNALLWLIIPVLIALSVWVFSKPHILDFILLKSIPESLIDELGGNPNMLIDIIKATDPKKIFPGTNPIIINSAIYFHEINTLSNSIAYSVILIIGLLAGTFSIRKITFSFKARQAVEKTNINLLILCSTIAIITTIGIILSLIFEAIRFFEKVNIFDFLFGLTWSPQTAIRDGQVASEGAFGAMPIFSGTLLITLVAMFVAIPIGLLSAIYLSEYARPKIRSVFKPILEILAGVPTVVYGFFAAITVGPFLKNLGGDLGFDIASESAIAAGGVMGIMIIPFISSLSDDVIKAVPQSLRDGSFALGATKSETVKKIILPAALPGIMAAVLLAISRAIGETMIVVMAAGIAANLTSNPFESVTTVTVQIVTLLVGDQEFDSAKTLAAFALGITLFFATLFLNVIALRVVQKYREIYE